jgi:thiol-disulfide isomerase/thioredoxin
MNLHDSYLKGLPFEEFIRRHGTEPQQARWRGTLDMTQLTDAQKALLASFKREMHVLVLAGVWCGDCSSQCPIFERFAEAAPVIQPRYVDRDVHADVQQELKINAGNRVPVAVFFSEDGFEVSRFGERTLAKYRKMMQEFGGDGCSTGLVKIGDNLQTLVIQEWLEQFERAQYILRLSPRLRQKHRD